MVATLAFNGLNLNSDPYYVQSIDGLLSSPEIRSADKPLVSRNGLVAGIDKYSGKSVILILEVISLNEAGFNTAVNNFKTAFAAPLATSLPLTFTIPGVANGQAARINVRPRKVSLPIEYTYQDYAGVANIEFYATDALIYSDTESSISLAASQPASGRTYDRIYDVSYGAGGSYGSAIITNNGSALAPVQIRINGPVENPTIRNVTTGQSLGFTAVIDAGRFIDIDTTNRTVMLDGTADRYSYLTTPEWWGLVPGANEIRYIAGFSVGSTATVTYRSAWI